MAFLKVDKGGKGGDLGNYCLPNREDEGSEDSSRALFVDTATWKLEGSIS